MTEPLDLESIEKRCGAATAGPWHAYQPRDNCYIKSSAGTYIMEGRHLGGVRLRADAEFIAHAREDIPALLAEVARLRAVVASREIARLAYEGARVQHVNAAPCNEFLTSTGVHVFVATDDDYGFATCPHPDCVLARDVLTRPPGASCASEAPKT